MFYNTKSEELTAYIMDRLVIEENLLSTFKGIAIQTYADGYGITLYFNDDKEATTLELFVSFTLETQANVSFLECVYAMVKKGACMQKTMETV